MVIPFSQSTDLASAETHISTLFFSRDRVYKLLKPIANGFLDHRDTDERCVAALREFELNRRISPNVYLGTADVVENGDLVDRMIVMQRLPAEQSVTALLRAGKLTTDHLREIAKAVASFHASLTPEYPDSDVVEEHRTRWTDNTSEMAPFVGAVLRAEDTDRITHLFTRWLNSHGALLRQRIADGHVRDGHGDLLADDIFCLDTGPEILDCLAFRDDLRLVDVLDDIAFLAMDLHRLGGPALAQHLIKWYVEFSGENHPSSLAHYYVAYRAHVRAKIACLRFEAGEQQFAAIARMYHRLCLDQLERAQLRLIMVGGGPGTGKTTLARALGRQFGCVVLATDEIRKDLAGVDRTTHYFAEPDMGIYTDVHTEHTYDELLRQANLLMLAGETVILDASWTNEGQRARARSLAAERNADLVALECALPSAIATERIVRRLADPESTSDATPDVVEHMKRLHEPWPDAIQIDGNQSTANVEQDALDAIRARGRGFINDPNTPRGGSFWGRS